MSSTERVPARDESGRVVLTAHADVVAAAHCPAAFSNAVSRHLQIPNGLDGAAHTAARRLFEPFFAPGVLADLEPGFERIADDLLDELAARGDGFDIVRDFGIPFAIRAQSSWLGWEPKRRGTPPRVGGRA